MNDTENSGQVIYETTPSARLRTRTLILAGHSISTTEGVEACITSIHPLGSEFAIAAIALCTTTLNSLDRRVGY